ncbi:MAG: hypothetical protein KKB51_07420 [Candidatus Riflebacteria bacterium]|nr:hypothetical protein [Candidatus Riflebacteria bacterium]
MGNNFKIPTTPVSKKVILAYFDLRKFSQIEGSMDANGVYEILNDMHEKITDKVESLNGYCLRYIGDNALAVFEAEDFSNVLMGVKEVKVEVDSYFSKLNKSSVLHILLHTGQGNIGLVGGRRNKRLDVSGPVLNDMGYYMMRVDTSGNIQLFNSLCISDQYYENLGEDIALIDIQASDCKFHSFIEADLI